MVKTSFKVHKLFKLLFLSFRLCFFDNGSIFAWLLRDIIHLRILKTINIVESAPLAGRCLCHNFYFLTELVYLKWIVILLSRVPIKYIFSLFIVINLLKIAALYLKLELLTRSLKNTVGAFHLKCKNKFSLGAEIG